MPNTTTLGNPFQLSSNSDEADDDEFDMKTPPPPPAAVGRRPVANPVDDDDAIDNEAVSKLRQMYSSSSDAQKGRAKPYADDVDEDDDFRYTGPKAAAKTGIQANDTHVDLPTEGDIMARVSSRSLFTKSWDPMYWVIDDHDLYLYRTKSDFLHNPRYTGYKKKIPIVHNLRALKIHRKDYPGLGSMLNFMLEEVFDYGPVNVAKFASSNKDNIEPLYEQLKSRIMQKRKQRA